MNLYFLLERVHGGELFDRIIKKKFYNEKEARDLAVVILKALKHCHDHKIAHRYVRVTLILSHSIVHNGFLDCHQISIFYYGN